MKLHRPTLQLAAHGRRGVALLMAFLVLMVVLAICAQLRVSTGASQRTANNDFGVTRMEQAIESSLLEIFDQLKTDADSAGAEEGGTGAPGGAGAPAAPPGIPGGGGAGGGQQEPVDSREDAWGKPQRTEINQVELRVIVQDEDSKVNVLGMIAEDESEAEKAYVRVVRIIDSCRQGTTEDIDSGDAERMAIVMRDHLRKRSNSVAPRAKLLSDSEDDPDLGLPLTLKEFAAMEPFKPEHFRDYRDARGKIVHSLSAYLTVHTALRTGDSLLPQVTSMSGAGGASKAPSSGGNNSSNTNNSNNSNTNNSSSSTGGSNNPPSGSSGSNNNSSGNASQGGAGGQGNSGSGSTGGGQTPGAPASGSSSGIAVNVNTAPVCVLKALMDDREVSGRWWDSVVEYRNLEEKKEDGAETEEADPVYDEYGREVLQRQVFDNLAELDQVPGTDRLPGDAKAEVLRLLTTQSNVFSIYITARIVSDSMRANRTYDGPPPPGEREDELGNSLTRSVRAIVWRVTSEDGTTIVPIVRWEVLDYIPFEVQDYPDDDR